MVKIIICGVCGRMGSRILALAEQDKKIEVVGVMENRGTSYIGSTVGKNKLVINDILDKIISTTEVVIDFTSPEATLEQLPTVVKNQKSIVIGTTGFSADQQKLVKESAKEIPIVMAPNMSVGVNLLFKLVSNMAKVIPNYDVEIIELHHNQKKDAPSGTAIKLAQIVAESLNRDLDKTGVYGRKGIVGARKPEEIGVMSVRAGDIVGEHTVLFAGPGERIELTHRAHSRDTFAAGALVAAKWVINQKPGLYDMQDVLGLK